jgi:tRNA threonylcarbamoyladenosine biosynthesis protein TsaE
MRSEDANGQLELADRATTERLGHVLAETLCPGDSLFLIGDMGAGKSTLARAIIRQASRDGALAVPSPTFTLAQTYITAVGEIWHLDLYRIESPDELEDLGVFDAFEDAITIIEWPDRLGVFPPARRLEITLKIQNEHARLCAWRAIGAKWPKFSQILPTANAQQ